MCREYSLMQYLVGIYSWFYKLLFFTYTDGLRKVKRMPWMVITTPSKSWCICAGVLSHVQLFVTLWIVASQAPLCMGFSRREYRSGLSFPPPGDLPDPEIKPASLTSPALAGGFFTTGATWEASALACSPSNPISFRLPVLAWGPTLFWPLLPEFLPFW